MINLTTNVTQPNINRWQVLAFDVNSGRGTLRFWSPANTSPTPLFVDRDIALSDTAGASTGVKINPAPTSWDDKIYNVGGPRPPLSGIGAANALTNALTAYRGAANHAAGLRAIEGSLMTDGIVDAALAGA